jgi:type I restriction enzyme S subunit
MTPSGIPWVKISDATAAKSRFIDSTAEFIRNEGGRFSVAVHPGDFILSNSATPGLPKIMRINACIHDGWLLLRNFRGITKEYCYYLLLNERPKLVAQGNGSVFTNLKTEILKSHVVEVPSLSEQEKVSEFLLALDDRIDLLRQTNATLESIARALFKSWFIDFDPVRAKAEGHEPEGMDTATGALFPAEFEESVLGLIPKGWSPGKLEVVCSNPRVQAKPSQMPPETPYIGLEHMPRKSIALGDAGTAEGLESGKFWFERNDVLFGKLRPYFHKVGLAPFRGVCSTDILVLRPKSPGWLGFLAMYASSDALISHTTQLSNGARMPRTSWQDVGGFDVTLPPNSVASAFDAAVKPMFERIRANIDSTRTLASLRDTLLPRLISGKLQLPEAIQELEAA